MNPTPKHSGILENEDDKPVNTKEEYMNLLLFGIKTDKKTPEELYQEVREKEAEEAKQKLLEELQDDSGSEKEINEEPQNDQVLP